MNDNKSLDNSLSSAEEDIHKLKQQLRSNVCKNNQIHSKTKFKQKKKQTNNKIVDGKIARKIQMLQ